ncbi:MAG: flavodoxin family protein [Mogibacterium sp.]|nr:flavodoxin family protein [Mogibacterium sp.]
MNLVIHDLKPEIWNKISEDYARWDVISDNGNIKPCIGCFSCWNKDPGRCVIRDGYDSMGYRIHHAEEVTVISRYTYGGFSGFVKNTFDRSLGYVLPQFEVINGETHHKKRYDEEKLFTFIFYGHDLTEEQKEIARRYVRAVCANIRGRVKDVLFKECTDDSIDESSKGPSAAKSEDPGKIVLLNGSMRSANGNSAKLARRLRGMLHGDTEIINLSDHMKDMSQLVRLLEPVQTIVLCVPLYVDGLPSQVIRLLERFELEYCGDRKKIYVLTNMGLYESGQLISLFATVKQWCEVMDFDYCGGLGVSAGELLGTLMEVLPFRKGPTRKVAEGMQALAEAINDGSSVANIFAEPHRFPRSLYIFIANTNWNRTARRNGIKPQDLYRRL